MFLDDYCVYITIVTSLFMMIIVTTHILCIVCMHDMCMMIWWVCVSLLYIIVCVVVIVSQCMVDVYHFIIYYLIFTTPHIVVVLSVNWSNCYQWVGQLPSVVTKHHSYNRAIVRICPEEVGLLYTQLKITFCYQAIITSTVIEVFNVMIFRKTCSHAYQ